MSDWDHIDPLKVVITLERVRMYCRLIFLTALFILGVVIFK